MTTVPSLVISPRKLSLKFLGGKTTAHIIAMTIGEFCNFRGEQVRALFLRPWKQIVLEARTVEDIGALEYVVAHLTSINYPGPVIYLRLYTLPDENLQRAVYKLANKTCYGLHYPESDVYGAIYDAMADDSEFDGRTLKKFIDVLDPIIRHSRTDATSRWFYGSDNMECLGCLTHNTLSVPIVIHTAEGKVTLVPDQTSTIKGRLCSAYQILSPEEDPNARYVFDRSNNILRPCATEEARYPRLSTPHAPAPATGTSETTEETPGKPAEAAEKTAGETPKGEKAPEKTATGETLEGEKAPEKARYTLANMTSYDPVVTLKDGKTVGLLSGQCLNISAPVVRCRKSGAAEAEEVPFRCITDDWFVIYVID